MSKTAVVYYSQSGNTAFVAEKIKEIIDADLIALTPVETYPNKGLKKFLWGGRSSLMAEMPELAPYEFDASKYDAVIFGYPVWASNVTPPLRTFIAQQNGKLNDKKILAYACQMAVGGEKSLNHLKEALGINAYVSTLVLNDPKDKPKPEHEAAIERFLKPLES